MAAHNRQTGSKPGVATRWAGWVGLAAILLLAIAFGLAWVSQEGEITSGPTGGPIITERPTAEGTPTSAIPVQPEDLRLLWLDSCDPRSDPEFCHLSDSLDILTDFLAVIDDLGATLEYRAPFTAAALEAYDVVIANFCGRGGRSVPAVEQYLQAGGSVVAMGDEFCRGVEDVDGQWTTSAALADALSSPRGIHVSALETAGGPWLEVVQPHPVTLGIERLYMPGGNALVVSPPAIALAARDGEPQIAVYDGTGTLIVIPNIGFSWSRADAPAHQNFVLWRNMLTWLGATSRVKRAAMPPLAAPGEGATAVPTLALPPYIRVGRQVVDFSGNIVIGSVYAPDGGWLALHEGGPEGPVLARTVLRQGTHNALAFTLDVDRLPDELWAVLHEDSGLPGQFDYPEADPPVSWQGQPVATLFGLERITLTPWMTASPRVTLTPWMTPTPWVTPSPWMTPTPWVTPTP